MTDSIKSYTICETCSGDLETGAYTVTNSISSTSTPEEFDAVMTKNSEYKLEYGGRCGWNSLGSAAYKGNVQLVKHILLKSSEPSNAHSSHSAPHPLQDDPQSLLNLGNGFGWTPLYCACQEEEGYAAAKELILQGADINMATKMGCGDSAKGSTPRKSTPLWAAIEKAKCEQTIKLLLENDAVLHPLKLSPEGEKLYELVKQKIHAAKEVSIKQNVVPINNLIINIII